MRDELLQNTKDIVIGTRNAGTVILRRMVIAIGAGVSFIFRIHLNFYLKRLFTCNRDEILSRDETHHGMKKFLFTLKLHSEMKLVQFHLRMIWWVKIYHVSSIFYRFFLSWSSLWYQLTVFSRWFNVTKNFILDFVGSYIHL